MNDKRLDNEDIFECKMYITDLETNKDSKEIDVSDLVFKDWIEFEFGDYEDDDYGTLPYKDFKFFINDYSVTFYSPQYHKLKQQINQLQSNWNSLREFFEMIPNYYMDKRSNNNGVYIQEGMERFRKLALDKMNKLERKDK